MSVAVNEIPPGGDAPDHPGISIVVPFYNESPGIALLFARLVPVLEGLRLGWEVVCVNDGSRDDTLERLVAAHEREPRIKVIDLSRNFGKEIALSAGLAHARGQAVVPMDADLQHPPEALPALVARWREGFEVVHAVRTTRVGRSLAARILAPAFYWLFDRLSDVALPRDVGDFRLLDRKVVDVINAMPERSRFMKGIFAWVGFRSASVAYAEGERAAGDSKWGAFGLIGFAFDGLASFSTFPLRVWGMIGAAISLGAFLYIVLRLMKTLIFGIDVPGYESLLITILFLGGVQLLTLGVLGDYLGRVFNEVKGRPLYIVRQSYGFQKRETGLEPIANSARSP